MSERTKIDAFRTARVWWTLVVAGCAACGCGSDPEVGDGCLRDLNCTLPLAWRCEGDSIPVHAAEGRGVFVSASLGDDAHAGTKDQPVRTFHQALALAAKGPKLVYACAEEFTEAVTVSSDVEIWGGFDCTDGWRDVHGSRRTTLRADPGSIPLQIAGFVPATVLVADLQVEASSATSPGGSSIAMLAAKGTTVAMCRSELIAGNGKDGAPGEDAALEPAQKGRPGNPGVDACQKDPTPGGAPVATRCGDIETIGGIGGDGNAVSGNDGYDGLPIPVPNPDGWGLGGAGETADAQCNDGERGRNGDDGGHGNGPGVSGLGVLTTSGWEGVPGEDGHDGLPGHGGGGGGGSRGGTVACGMGPQGGASGGSGGSGACGGKGGKGGGYGGSSIGLVSLAANVTLREVPITTGNGGHGGAGGHGQFGGRGGQGGIGGAGRGGSKPGCNGGPGGTGGNGGHGSGGIGGHSIGVAFQNGGTRDGDRGNIAVGEAGTGGPDGNAVSTESHGADGISLSEAAFL